MHHVIIQCTVLLIVILFVVMLAQRIKIAYPILLVIAGLILGFVPFMRGLDIQPDLIFVIFLPPLLYEAAWNTSWKDFWRWRRVISSFAFLIVIVTSCVIAVISNACIGGFTLALGFLLGGIISPPDAVSASTILKTLPVPKRLVAIVEGESLMNDASGLIVFRFALEAVDTGKFVFSQAALSFVIVIVMGIAVGLAVALIFYAIHRWLPTTPVIDIILTFVTPYAMYMAAEEFHFSGVLAVVSGGLFLSVRRHTILSYRSRLQGTNVWEAVAFGLNGFIFMLIGLEFPVVIKGLDGSISSAVLYSVLITVTLLVTRMLSTSGAAVFTKFISRYIKTEDPNPGWKGPVLLGWAGMRGVVSLAAALSIPVALHSGAPFPQRNMILFITFSVIVASLLIQGLTLPWLVRVIDMPDPDYTLSPAQQQQLVRKKLNKLSLQVLSDKYREKVSSNDMLKALQIKQTADMDLLKDWELDGAAERSEAFYRDYLVAMFDIMQQQRDLLKTLNKKEGINDEIIRHQLDLLDLEEEKMRQHFSLETD